MELKIYENFAVHRPMRCAAGTAAIVGGIIGSAVIGSAASSISTASAAKSQADAQKSANETNLQIARETNEANTANTAATNATQIQLQREMNDFNVQQWNRNNEYNSPANQMARARAAGINPNVVASDAASVASSPVQQLSTPQLSVPNLVTPQVSPVNEHKSSEFISNAISDISKATGSYYMNQAQIELTKQQADSLRIQNERERAADAWFRTQTGFKFQFIDEDDSPVRGDNIGEVVANPRVTAVRFQFKNKGEFEAYMRSLQASSERVGYDADKSEALARQSRAQLDKLVIDEQTEDGLVVMALKNMPFHQYQKLVNEATKVLVDTSTSRNLGNNYELDYQIKDWDWKLSQQSDTRNIVREIFDKLSGNNDDLSFKDVSKMILMCLIPTIINSAASKFSK